MAPMPCSVSAAGQARATSRAPLQHVHRHRTALQVATTRTTERFVVEAPDTQENPSQVEVRCPVLRAAKVVPKNPQSPWSGIQGILNLLFEPVHITQANKLQGHPLVEDQLLGAPVYLVGDKDMSKQVLSATNTFHSFWPASIAQLQGPNALISVDGAAHQHLRNLLQPVMKPVAGYANIPNFERLADSLLAAAADSTSSSTSPQSMQDLLSTYTFESISRVVMGFNLPQETHTQLKQHMATLSAGMFLPAIDLPFTPFGKALAARAAISSIVTARISQVRRQLEEGMRPAGLLTDMLTATDDQGNTLTDAQIVDNFIVLLFAGTDTTACVLTTICYNLMKQPHLMAALVEEQERLQAAHGPELTKQVLLDMQFAEQCIMEALRSNHPVGAVFRRAAEDTELGGYAVAAGTNMSVALPHMLWRDKVWEGEKGDLALDKYNPFRYGTASAPAATGSTTSGVGPGAVSPGRQGSGGGGGGGAAAAAAAAAASHASSGSDALAAGLVDAFTQPNGSSSGRSSSSGGSSSGSSSGGGSGGSSGAGSGGAAWNNPFQLAFGSGPRTCIGASLSIIETKVFLAVLARRYRLRLAKDSFWMGPVPRLANGCPTWVERL